jgi:hypothetical protein
MPDIRLHFDGDKMAVETSQDVGDILENNKRKRSETQKSDWGREVAEIPNVILVRWLNEEWARGNMTIRLFGPEMDALVARKLKDPEWAFLRTDSAQVQSFMGFGS